MFRVTSVVFTTIVLTVGFSRSLMTLGMMVWKWCPMPELLSASGRSDSLPTVTRDIGRGLCAGGVTTATRGFLPPGFLTGGLGRTMGGWADGFVEAVAG